MTYERGIFAEQEDSVNSFMRLEEAYIIISLRKCRKLYYEELGLKKFQWIYKIKWEVFICLLNTEKQRLVILELFLT